MVQGTVNCVICGEHDCICRYLAIVHRPRFFVHRARFFVVSVIFLEEPCLCPSLKFLIHIFCGGSFDAVYGYGTDRMVPRAAYAALESGVPPAPRYPFDYMGGPHYPGFAGPPQGSWGPLGYDPILSKVREEHEAAKAAATKKA